MIAILVLKNRELEAQAQEIEIRYNNTESRFYDIDEKANATLDNAEHETKLKHDQEVQEIRNKKVKISILGKSDSESLGVIQESGIKVTFNRTQDSPFEKIEIGPSELEIISDNPQDIGEQDHIIVATKTFSHDEYLLQSIEALKKKNQNESEQDFIPSTVVLAQNAIPCWYIKKSFGYQKKETLSADFIKQFEHDNNFVTRIGSESLVACVLNFESSFIITDNQPQYGEYTISTPLEKVGVPISLVLDDDSKPNISNLRDIFYDAGIKTQITDSDITREMLLKLQINVTISGLCTILGTNISELLEENNKYRELALLLGKEIGDFSRCEPRHGGLRSKDNLSLRLENSAAHYPSMERDFILGKPIETEIFSRVIMISSEMNWGEMFYTKNVFKILKEMVKIRDEAIEASKTKKGVSDETMKEILSKAVEDSRKIAAQKLEKLFNVYKQRHKDQSPPRNLSRTSLVITSPPNKIPSDFDRTESSDIPNNSPIKPEVITLSKQYNQNNDKL
ncbi:MAG: ketopantoate reductase C-terminal domain-containing protein [Rickettsiales bacterium]|nr:ketopantoate reductase C-terminal domain-containing protein [Rickettsiales bacterium]